ncbi:tyrosine-type recombinase/integrase [Micromonospora sp. STR1s_5]|nr:tyrosine-type recombinase/integrase [Micromonospora sp. STR1s_5]
MPSVSGFSENPNRAEFTRTLGTRDKGEANRRAAKITELIDRAFESAGAVADAASVGIAQTVPQGKPLRPGIAFDALARWKEREIEAAEQRLFNGEEQAAWFEGLSPDAVYHLGQFGHHPRSVPEDWKKVPGFDTALRRALGTQGVDLAENHPATSRLRPTFAVAWHEVLDCVRHMRMGLWDWQPEDAQPSAAQAAEPSPKPGLPIGSHAEEWHATLDMRPRQKGMYLSDVREFASAIAGADTNSLTNVQVQGWAAERLQRGITVKTIRRKLSAIRLYWRYLKAHGHTQVGVDVFADLYLRQKQLEQRQMEEPAPYRVEEVVELWKTARSMPRGQELAKLIRLAAFTGARIESLCMLQKHHVRFEPNNRKEYIVLADKTLAGRREIPIVEAIGPFVAALVVGADDDGFLIRSTSKNKHGERSPALSKSFGRLKNKLGFGSNYDFHSFRRTVATLLESSGCPENVAADILGHEKMTMSYGVYSGGSSLPVLRRHLEAALKYPDREFMGRP